MNEADCAMITKFQDLDTISAKEVSAALLRNDPEELQFVSITIALSELDHSYSQTICIKLCSSTDSRVRGNALASLGHLARRFGHLDELVIRPIIESSLQDSDEYVRTSAKSAADEIHQFLHWRIAGHVYG
jgi:HEAT repeat protein